MGDRIMGQLEPFVMNFNEMLQSLIEMTTIKEGELSAHPLVTLMKERRADYTQAMLHFAFMHYGDEAGNWTYYEEIGRDLWDDFKNRTDNFDSTPVFKSMFDLLGGYQYALDACMDWLNSLMKHVKYSEKMKSMKEYMMKDMMEYEEMNDEYGMDPMNMILNSMPAMMKGMKGMIGDMASDMDMQSAMEMGMNMAMEMGPMIMNMIKP